MAVFLERQIASLQAIGINQRDIALDAGYPQPNILSMFKRGETKVPLNKVTALAKALKVDPAFFFRLAVQQEGMPLTPSDIEKIFPHNVTANEMALVQAIREALQSKGLNDPQLDARQTKTIVDVILEEVTAKSTGQSLVLKQL